MKTIKNDKASYKSRASLGGLKEAKTPKNKNSKPREFDIDSRGYLVWAKQRAPFAR